LIGAPLDFVAHHGEHQDGSARTDRDDQAIAAQEFAEPIAEARRLRRYRLAIEISLHVIRHRGGGRIASLRFFLQGFEYDAVDVAAQLPRQLLVRDAARTPRFLQNLRAGLAHLGRGDGLLEDGARCTRVQAIRPIAGEQLEQHHAQRIDVAFGGDRIAADHFGARVNRREHRTVNRGERRLARGFAIVQQRRDAEVEQPHLTGLGDEDVRGLEITVDDLTLMRVLHRLEHLQEQPQPRADVESLRIAPVGEQLALHVLHRQVGQAQGVDAGVVQARNMRMLQARENVAFANEALFQIAAHARQRRQL